VPGGLVILDRDGVINDDSEDLAAAVKCLVGERPGSDRRTQ